MDRLKDAYKTADRLSGGLLGLLKDSFRRFGDARAPEAAASMAYYAFFSLFPLMLTLIALGSFFLEREQASQQVVEFVVQGIPISRELIERNVKQVLDLRGTVGVVGLVGLLWSATGVFSVLAHNVNRAWSEAESRSFLERRLVALGMVGALAGLLALSVLSTVVLSLLPQLQIPLAGGMSIYDTTSWAVLSNLVPWMFTFLMFLALYRWVPNTVVAWPAAAAGALIATLAWEGITGVFTWYLRSGLVRYELIYGSLGAVVVLMLWIYLGSWITLLGAHLSAAVARHC
jgi:membrane protein